MSLLLLLWKSKFKKTVSLLFFFFYVISLLRTRVKRASYNSVSEISNRFKLFEVWVLVTFIIHIKLFIKAML